MAGKIKVHDYMADEVPVLAARHPGRGEAAIRIAESTPSVRRSGSRLAPRPG